MTDRDPTQDLDELASVHLDGLSTPAEATRVEADPNLQQRVARMARARHAVATGSAPVDPVRREAAIDAALQAFDLAALETEPAPEAGITSLLEVTARRTGMASRTLRLLAAAAVVVLLALAVPLLARLGEGDARDDLATAVPDQEATTGGSRPDPESDPADAAGDGGEAASGRGLVDQAAPESEGASNRLESLGTFDDVDELAAALRPVPVGTTGEPTTTAAGTGLNGLACPAERRRLEDGSTVVVRSGPATLAGRAVVAAVYAGPGQEPRLVVWAAADCTTVIDRPL